jgi:hypothetical protein
VGYDRGSVSLEHDFGGERAERHALHADGEIGHRPVFVEFLRRVITGAKRPMLLIVDERPTHRSSIVRKFLRRNEGCIRLFFLPPYSPALNPNEQVWREVKSHGGGRKSVASKKVKQHLLRPLCYMLYSVHATKHSYFSGARNYLRNGGVNLLTCGTVNKLSAFDQRIEGIQNLTGR